jgi:hypothetical protein
MNQIITIIALVAGIFVVMAVIGRRYARSVRSASSPVIIAVHAHRQNRANRIFYILHKEILKNALKRFHKNHGAYPSDLRKLISDGLLAAIPARPGGGNWNYDSRLGKIH